MNEDYYHEQNSCYDYNSFGFDQFQPPQYTVNHPIFNSQNEFLNTQNELLNSSNKLMEQMKTLCDLVGQAIQKNEEERRIAEEQVAKDRYWKIPICYDDDDDYTSAITPNIDYVDASPPDAEIVSLEVVEIVIPEVGGIDTDILLTIKDDILRENFLNVNLLIANIEALKDNPAPSSDVMTKSPSTSLNQNSSGSTTTRSDYSFQDYEAFYDDHIEEKSSGSTTTHADFSQYDSFIFDLSINPIPPADRSDFYHEKFADKLAHIISPLEYDCFCFKIEPELGNLTMDVVNDIFPTREPRVHVPNILPTHPTLDLDFIL
ncbi:hypothetical protein Tco_0133372 [Tanacetum coccineum]